MSADAYASNACLTAANLVHRFCEHRYLDIKILFMEVLAMPPAEPNPREPDFVDRLITRWEQGSPPRVQFRQQEALLRLVRMGGHLRREMEEIAESEGLVAGQAQALVTVRWYDPEPTIPKEVMSATTLTSGAVTAVIDRLEDRKLLKRHADPDDRRGTLLRLTESGRAAADRIIAARLARNDRWLSALDESERATLTHLLRKMLAAGEAPPP
jgi:DNA-binding MarR family transcriptional regulator